MSDSVKCPFCCDEYDDLFDLFSGDGDGAEAIVECYGCGREYTITQNISVTYTTDPDPDFEEYLDRHPEIRNILRANQNRIKAIINGECTIQ